jgi:hypothetical protein
MKNALFVLSGNCRTFIDCIDSMIEKLFFKLFSEEDINIYIYLYLKLTDPGPKGQDGWNFKYKNNDYYTILDKINNIKSKCPKYNIEYNILNDDNISNSELISQVKDRSLYKGHYSKDNILIRGLHCHYNFERCGNYILEKEISIQSKFDYIIYVRPDLFFIDCCNDIKTYNTSIVTLGEGPYPCNNDHIAIVPRQHLNAFFFDRMTVYRNNINKSFTIPEEVYWHTITYEVKSIGKYFIKRS